MIKEILIALVAVVVVILIIAFAALRFLRADDSDTFDDLPDEPSKQARLHADSGPMAAPVQRHLPPRPEPAARDQQTRALPRAPERASAERAAGAYRDLDRQSRPVSAGRRPTGTGQRGPVTAARGSRPARQTEPDTHVAASWDAMSDVDYWTELAADKPLTAAAAGPAETARRRVPDGQTDRHPDGKTAPRDDKSAGLPIRQRTHPQGRELATQNIAALARLGAQQPATPPPTAGPRPAPRPDQLRPDQSRQSQPRTGPRPAIGRAPQAPPAAPVSYPGAQGRLPLPLDDDPLTSPSFPAINAADSRSYRTRRPGSAQQARGRDRTSGGVNRPAPASQPAPASRPGRASQAGQIGRRGQASQPAEQFAAPPLPDRSASAPNGYPVQAPAAAPAANPYGSFVGPPQAGHTDAATGNLGGPGYGNGYVGSSPPAVPDAGWYANGNGYYDPGHNAAGNHVAEPAHPGARASDSGYAGDGFAGAEYYRGYGDSPYQGSYPTALPAGGYTGGAFQGSQPDSASYQPNGQFARHHDQHAIAAPDLAYGNDGYHGYQGYGGNGP